ncbi:MAG: type B DNA-directed DNA polymerase [Halobacteria archaeon]
MVFKIDYVDGDVLEWSAGGSYSRVSGYTPTIYVSTPPGDDDSDGSVSDPPENLAELRGYMQRRSEIEDTGFERKRRYWSREPEIFLRIDARDPGAAKGVAHEIRGYGEPGEYRLYNVDLEREFRYCLDRGIDPSVFDYTTVRIEVPSKKLDNRDLTLAEIDGETVRGSEEQVLSVVDSRLRNVDPDVLILSHSDIIPLMYEKAAEWGMPGFEIGRMDCYDDGFQVLARQSTYESFGKVGDSPPRYNVSGRAIIDLSNSFFWGQTNLDGMMDLVERSHKPIQEASWASIGNVFTSIQIRKAFNQDPEVLVPWKAWRHEKFKTLADLHGSDRGGFIFSPDVGVHENVYEVDFSSLYPNIICIRNVSPDRIRCDCHDRSDVPGLGYSICDEEGFLPEVLRPLIEDRKRIKREIKRIEGEGIESGDVEDCDGIYLGGEDVSREDRLDELRGRSEALKWILVSCFGYQGFSNAKFGRIECHESINAFAREILLDAKESFESRGWSVVHGIVDSIWVQPPVETKGGRDSSSKGHKGCRQEELRKICSEISKEVGIDLEYEDRYDWISFVPRRTESAGALNRYFGRVSGKDEYKIRGIEARQRSTPEFVEDVQMDMLDCFDRNRDPEAVCSLLERRIKDLRDGDVDPDDLYVKKRVSKDKEEYSHRNRNVAALHRAEKLDYTVRPGQDVRYVVVDDSKKLDDRVRLGFEDVDTYDPEYYRELLVRAAESVLSPLGWKRDRIKRYLDETRESKLTGYV